MLQEIVMNWSEEIDNLLRYYLLESQGELVIFSRRMADLVQRESSFIIFQTHP